MQKVAKLSTKGFSPLAYSLKHSADDANQVETEPLAVILIATAKDSCGGDPLAAVKTLKEKLPQATIYTVNFFGDADTQQQLTEIAADGDGKIYDIQSDTEVAKTFNEIGTVIASLAKTSEATDIKNTEDYTGDEPATDNIDPTTPGTTDDSTTDDGTTTTTGEEPTGAVSIDGTAIEQPADDAGAMTGEAPVADDTSVPSDDSANVATPSDEESGLLNSTMMFYGFIGFGVLIVLLSIIALVSRRKKAQFAEQAAMTAQPAATAPSPEVAAPQPAGIDLSEMVGTDEPATPAVEVPATPTAEATVAPMSEAPAAETPVVPATPAVKVEAPATPIAEATVAPMSEAPAVETPVVPATPAVEAPETPAVETTVDPAPIVATPVQSEAPTTPEVAVAPMPAPEQPVAPAEPAPIQPTSEGQLPAAAPAATGAVDLASMIGTEDGPVAPIPPANPNQTGENNDGGDDTFGLKITPQ